MINRNNSFIAILTAGLTLLATFSSEAEEWKLEIDPLTYADHCDVVFEVLDVKGYAVTDNVEIAAFVDDECRGTVDYAENGQYMVLIYANEGDVISFKLWDANDNCEHSIDYELTYDLSQPTQLVTLQTDITNGLRTVNVDYLSSRGYTPAGLPAAKHTQGVVIYEDGKKIYRK